MGMLVKEIAERFSFSAQTDKDLKKLSIDNLTSEELESLFWWFTCSVVNNDIFYKDRISCSRGPLSVSGVGNLYGAGVIDLKTIFWTNGLLKWIPLVNINLISTVIRTGE